MGEVYLELCEVCDCVVEVLCMEEVCFFEIIEYGMLIFDGVLGELKVNGGKMFDGEFVFKLYDIFGFLLDLM